MPTQSAAEHFLKLLERSGIVPAEQVSCLVDEIEESGGDLRSADQIAEGLVAQSVLTRWQADQLLEGKYKGFILGPYRILTPLGQGGMGTVFLAEHQMMRRRCAVKVLPSKRVQTQPALVEWFYREAQAVAALDHPNIVRAYDAYKAVQDNREIHYLVMEYIEGQDLQRRVAEQGLAECGEAVDWIRQAAEGLAHAHEAGFVHRDIKPANLLVDARGVVKILDLGLARFFSDQDEAGGEQGGLVVGTADYVAPEQIVDSHNVDARADIYSLGHTFYYLLTGHPPFPGGSVPQRLLAHQTKFPEPIQRERPDVPPEIVAIVGRMTAKKPKDRQQTAREVAEALKKWIEGSSGGSDHGGFLRRFARTPPKNASTITSHDRAGNGSAQADSEQTQEADLELAPLDDESQQATGAGAADGAGLSSQPVSPDGSDSSEAMDSTPPSPGSKSQGDLTEANHETEPGLSSELADLGAPPDPLADLLDSESFPAAAAAPHPDDRATEKSATTKPTAKKKKRNNGPEKSFLQPPVLWVGIGALVAVIAIVWFMASQFSPNEPSSPTVSTAVSGGEKNSAASTSSQEDDADATGQATESSQRPTAKPSPAQNASPPETARKPPVAPPSDPAAPQAKPAPESPSKQASAGPQDKAQKRSQDGDSRDPGSSGKSASGKNGAPKPASQRPSDKQSEKTPPAAPKDSEKPPAKKQAPKKKPVDPKALFAGMKSIAFRMQKSIPHGPFNMMVMQQAAQAAQRAELELAQDEDPPAVMDLLVEVEPVKARAPVGVVTMSAELQCKGPDGEMVRVWKHHQALREGKPLMLQGRNLMLLRKDVGDFFGKFVDDYDEASGDKKTGKKSG